jgi:hypothetical protein
MGGGTSRPVRILSNHENRGRFAQNWYKKSVVYAVKSAIQSRYCLYYHKICANWNNRHNMLRLHLTHVRELWSYRSIVLRLCVDCTSRMCVNCEVTQVLRGYFFLHCTSRMCVNCEENHVSQELGWTGCTSRVCVNCEMYRQRVTIPRLMLHFAHICEMWW